MDVVLHIADEYVLDSLWAAFWPAVPHGSATPKAATPSQSAVANLTSHIAGWSASGDHLLNSQWAASSGKAVSALPRDNIIR